MRKQSLDGGFRRLVAYVAVKGGNVSSEELRRFCEARLPAYMVPAAFVTLDELPVTPNGKIDRKHLQALTQASSKSKTEPMLPETDLERQVAEVWAAVLRVDRVNRHDNFFELGGHSLLLVRVHTALKERFDTGLQVVDLFRYPTVSALAGAIRAESEVRAARPVSLKNSTGANTDVNA